MPFSVIFVCRGSAGQLASFKVARKLAHCLLGPFLLFFLPLDACVRLLRCFPMLSLVSFNHDSLEIITELLYIRHILYVHGLWSKRMANWELSQVTSHLLAYSVCIHLMSHNTWILVINSFWQLEMWISAGERDNYASTT